MAMVTAHGMLAAGLKWPYAVLHQVHAFRGGAARVNTIQLRDIGDYIGINVKHIGKPSKPLSYSNSGWGLAGVSLPEACFVSGGKNQPRKLNPKNKYV